MSINNKLPLICKQEIIEEASKMLVSGGYRLPIISEQLNELKSYHYITGWITYWSDDFELVAPKQYDGMFTIDWGKLDRTVAIKAYMENDKLIISEITEE